MLNLITSFQLFLEESSQRFTLPHSIRRKRFPAVTRSLRFPAGAPLARLLFYAQLQVRAQLRYCQSTYGDDTQKGCPTFNLTGTGTFVLLSTFSSSSRGQFRRPSGVLIGGGSRTHPIAREWCTDSSAPPTERSIFPRRRAFQVDGRVQPQKMGRGRWCWL